MRTTNTMTRLFILGVLLFTITGCPKYEYNSISPTTGTITGIVYNQNGDSVISGVSLTISSIPKEVYSNLHGFYIIPEVQQGNYQIIARKQGYFTKIQSVFVAKEKTCTENFYLQRSHPPSKPILYLPEDSSVNQPISLRFVWKSEYLDADYEQVTTFLYLGKVNTPITPVASVIPDHYTDMCEITLVNLDTASLYFWKVVARDESGEENSSDIYSFHTIKHSSPADMNFAAVQNGASIPDDSFIYYGGINGVSPYGTMGVCGSGYLDYIHALCDDGSGLNKKTVSYKSSLNQGSTWNNSLPNGIAFMVIDLGQIRTLNTSYVFQMFSCGKVTHARFWGHPNTSGPAPDFNDTGWYMIFDFKPITEGQLLGNEVFNPTKIQFLLQQTRFMKLEFKNDGRFGNPDYIEVRNVKLFKE